MSTSNQLLLGARVDVCARLFGCNSGDFGGVLASAKNADLGQKGPTDHWNTESQGPGFCDKGTPHVISKAAMVIRSFVSMGQGW